MKSRWILASLTILLVAACIALLVASSLPRHTVYARPETQSAFLKSYNPESVIKAFACNGGYSWSIGKSDSPGDDYAVHQETFHGEFEVEATDQTRLVAAVNNDVAVQLARNGARHFGGGGGTDQGFQFNYQVGKSLGVVIVAPLRSRTSERSVTGLPMALDIYVNETWLPNLNEP
jgi:hypothetical protein